MASFGGIDLGGTKIEAAIFDEDGTVLGSARRATPTAGAPQDVADAMQAALTEAARAADTEPARLGGVGVGSPGTVEGGTVSSARNLPGWEGSFELGPELERQLGCPVKLGNDVRVGTWAEFRLGAGRPYRSLLGVFWGTGVGGGVILDGRPWVGRGAGGEVGHVVVEMGGAKCTCGRHGCMEAYSGRAAMEAHVEHLHHDDGRPTDLFKIMREHGHTRLTSSVWARALEHGDELAHHMIDRAVRALGAGVASVANVLDVEAIVIGGGLGVRLGQPYVERITEAMLPHLFTDYDPAPVEVAALGDLGGAIGASLLVREPQAGGAGSATGGGAAAAPSA
jgi:glucokinase